MNSQECEDNVGKRVKEEREDDRIADIEELAEEKQQDVFPGGFPNAKISDPAGKELHVVTEVQPGKRQQAVNSESIESLESMPRPPRLFRAETQDAAGINVIIQFGKIGISVMQDVVLLAP